MHEHRRFTGSGTVLLLAAAGLVAGCRKETTPKLEVKSQSTETVPGGRRVTKTESTQVGSTLVKETQTTASGAAGSGKTDVNTYVGTVVSYTAGRSIEVLTGESDHHRVDLTGKDTTVDAEPGIAIGNRVRLVESHDSQGRRNVTISAVR
ncbi:MAG TPA: hypothetical protein VFS34_05435 [Thermoanaerobaculia bacterium]|nr:hypothetical protein [Thermoanaerobaculia bacterium]